MCRLRFFCNWQCRRSCQALYAEGLLGHYIYEFVSEKGRPLPFSATGSEIHTSDSFIADYYLSPRSEDVDYVYKTFFKRKYNAAVEQLFTKPVAANSDS